MAPENEESALDQAQARDLGRPIRTKAYPAVVDRWALIVGISRYRHEGWNLQFAHRDAQKLCELIQTPEGGGFDSNNVLLRIDEEATTRNLVKALRSFLKKPDRDDIVLLYFACHGAPDPDRPENIYLITHDTEPEDISGTALPMRDIDWALKETLRAERVVILADTCHSGGIGGGIGRRSGGTDTALVNKYLQDLSESRGGVALVTSAAANETSREDKRWGEGHGVFTHFLLQGMRGEANGYGSEVKDGVVSVGELFDYLRDQVKKATLNQQHPVIGTNPFDRRLPMAITGGIDAQQRYELGCRLYELAARLGDRKRFRAAAAQFQQAIQLSKLTRAPFPQAELALGKALLAADQVDTALDVLCRIAAREDAPVEAVFYLGITRVKRREYPEGIAAFEKYLARAPGSPNAPWVSEYLEWLKNRTAGRRHALLIGIDRYRCKSIPALRGCVNDTRLIRNVVVERCGFSDADIRILLDEQATRDGILNALAELSRVANANAAVIVHYSGHSVPESRRDVFGAKVKRGLYLVVHDTVTKSGELTNGILHDELHRAMNEIAAEHKTLILDTHPSTAFNELVTKEGNYALLLASDSAQIAYEHHFEVDGSILPAGLFTGTLARQLTDANPQTLTYGELINAAMAGIQTTGLHQTPLFIGNRGQLIFGEEDPYLSLFEFSEGWSMGPLTQERLTERYARVCSKINAPFPQAHLAFARALLRKRDYSAAARALATAVSQGAGAEAVIAAAVAQVRMGASPEAVTNLQKAAPLATSQPSIVAVHLARMLLALGDIDTAVRVLRAAVEADQTNAAPDAHFYLGVGYIGQDQQQAARDSFETFLAQGHHRDETALLREQAQWVIGWRKPCKHALLIGIGKYALATKQRLDLPGPANDARLLAEVLVKWYGFERRNMTLLLDGAATREGIISAFEKLAEVALPDDVAVVFFSGHSTYIQLEKQPDVVQDMFVTHDALVPDLNTKKALTGKELHKLIRLIPARHKTVILDPGGTELLALVNEAGEYALIMSASPGETVYDGATVALGGGVFEAGLFSGAVIRRLWEVDPQKVTAGEIVDAVTQDIREKQAPFSKGSLSGSSKSKGQTPLHIGDRKRVLFSVGDSALADDQRGKYLYNHALQTMCVEDIADELISSLDKAPMAHVIEMLEPIICQREQQNDLYPEGRLNLGIAYAAMRAYDKAISFLERAVALYTDATVMGRERERDPNADNNYHEARYQLGRVLFKSERDLSRAVSELNEATKLDPDNADGYYYLGQAIREMVERETLARAEEALQIYLAKGAPVGHEDEVREFLGSRMKPGERPEESQTPEVAEVQEPPK